MTSKYLAGLFILLTLSASLCSVAWAADSATSVVAVASNNVDSGLPPLPAAKIKLPPVPQKTVESASAVRIMHFNRDFNGGAHTDGGFNGGSPMVLALAAWQGNTAADARLLEQIRNGVISAKSSPTANGGYPAQHELQVTAALAVARMTPRVWNQFTPEEKAKIALVMKAELVGSAFTTSDASGGVPKPVAIDGDLNFNRGWNPNFREGMFGNLIATSVFFGGPAQANRILNAYDHDAFVAQLKAAGLTNTYKAFNWKADHPTSPAPDGPTIAAGIRNYRYEKQHLDDLMGLYYKLTTFTYGATVSAGLNGGKGFKDTGAGCLASGADKLPNKGKIGMLKELDSMDGGGPRSDMDYAYSGFITNLLNHLVLVVGGYWKPGPQADECLARLNIGIPDFFYKLEHGYYDYSKGHASKEVTDANHCVWSYQLTQSLWEDVVKPYHAAEKK